MTTKTPRVVIARFGLGNGRTIGLERARGIEHFLTSAGYTVEPGWRPIETAPRDGSKFWGRVGDDAIAMFWHPGFKAFVSKFRRMSLAPGMTFESGETHRDHSPEVHDPAQWRPLPASGKKVSNAE